MQNVNDLKDKIRRLESERSKLTDEIEDLRLAAAERVAELEGEVYSLQEQAKGLRECLIEKKPSIVPVPVKAEPQPTKFDDQPVSIEPSIEAAPDQLDSSNLQEEPMTSKIDLEKLTSEERKVIGILQAHGGKAPQKQIRDEADLKWLQASRVISRLVERGLISVERNGAVESIVLKSP